jgi:YfiH family protein
MPQTLFTSRTGGVSRAPFDSFNLALHVGDDPLLVLQNRKLLAEKIGISNQNIFFMNQVHGNRVEVIDGASDSANEPTADALFTKERGKALVVLVADCTPLLLATERAVAAVHVGRKGLVARVIDATLQLFDEIGVERDEIKAELGPSICANCYEVDLKTYQEVIAQVPSTATTNEIHRLNISKGIEAQLTESGVTYKTSQICVRDTEGYFSYRRSAKTGRQAGVIWL